MEAERSIWERTRQFQLVAFIMVVFGFGFVLGNQYTTSYAQSGGVSVPEDVAPMFDSLYEAYNLIDAQYINSPEPQVLVDGAIRGMVESLDDPYSNYVDPEYYRFVRGDLSGEIEGIGVVITENEETGEIEVVNVLQGTPAEREGVQPGDAFIVVDGEDVIGLTYLELASRVRGPSGSVVNIIMRRGDEQLDFSIERARIEIPNIATELLEGNIGYISMAEFSTVARAQVDSAIDELETSALNGLIFDLRGNPGGLLSSATEIAGLFLQEGIILIEDFGDGDKEVYEIRDDTVVQIMTDGAERTYSNNAAYRDLDVPIVVLIDERSASASELVAGAWQDHDVVTLVGTTSFGKGTVQLQNSLSNGGGMRLTVARWLTPNGAWISEQGVTPDIVVEIPEDVEVVQGEDLQLEAAVDFLLSQTQAEQSQ